MARRSAASVKRTNPWLKTAIFCAAEDDTTGFDQAFAIPDHMKRPKVEALIDSPFAETLYLDNDTIIRADLGSMFDLLTNYDMCGAQVILWHRKRHQKRMTCDLPDAFPEINCGVLLYRKNAETARFLENWTEAFLTSGMKIDQPSFRETLWNSDIRFYVLPPQFNKRVFEASELVWSDAPRARILHLEILRPQKTRLMAWLSDRIR